MGVGFFENTFKKNSKSEISQVTLNICDVSALLLFFYNLWLNGYKNGVKSLETQRK